MFIHWLSGFMEGKVKISESEFKLLKQKLEEELNKKGTLPQTTYPVVVPYYDPNPRPQFPMSPTCKDIDVQW